MLPSRSTPYSWLARCRLLLLVASIGASGAHAVAAGAASSPASPSPTPPRVVALIEDAQRPLTPEMRAVQAGLAHMLLSDLAAHPQLRVVSRETMSGLLAETQLGETALVTADTAQRLGRAARADSVITLTMSAAPTGAVVGVQLLQSGAAEPVWTADFPELDADLPALEAQILAALRDHLGLPQPPATPAPAGQPATLAVFDFQAAGPVAELDCHAAELADLLETYLSSAGGVQLVDRRRLAAVLQEQTIVLRQQGGAGQMQLGRLLGAQRFLYTTMVQWGGQVRFDSHLVEPQTGLIAATASAQGPITQAPTLIERLAREVTARLTVGPATPAASVSETAGLSLEAALHFARGSRLLRLPDYDRAIPELEAAAFLAPGDGVVWEALISACYYSERHAEAVRHARTFIQANPTRATKIRWRLVESLSELKDWPALEQAMREVLADPERGCIPSISEGTSYLTDALIHQGRWGEAMRYCESILDRGTDDMVGWGWMYALNNLLYGLHDCIKQGQPEPAPGALALLQRVAEVLPIGRPDLDSRVFYGFFFVLTERCLGSWRPESTLYTRPARDLEAGLAITEFVAERFRNDDRLPAMAGLTKGLLLARMDRPQAALAALQAVLTDYPNADLDTFLYKSYSPPANSIVHFYMGLIYEHVGRQARAAAEYRQVVATANSYRAAASFALDRLRQWGAPLPAPAAREKRIQAIPPLEWYLTDYVMINWLRSHGFRQWGLAWQQGHLKLGEIGALIIAYRGSRTVVPSPEDLAAWVAHGGRLLVVCGQFRDASRSGGDVPSSRATFDQTPNWLLPMFGIRMAPDAGWTRAEKRMIAPTANAVAGDLAPFEYSGEWWPLSCADDMAVLRLATGAEEKRSAGPVVAAARQFGLGRVAVVSLREWFPCGGAYEWFRPWRWEEPLFAGIMDWLTAPETDPRRQALVARFAQAWGAYMSDYPTGGARAFEGLSRVSGLPGEWAKFTAGRIVGWESRLKHPTSGQGIAAFRSLAASASDPWLRRASHLWAARLATEGRAPAEARRHYEAVTAAADDGLWAEAVVEQGGMAVEARDFQGAEARFREAANALGHSEERLRALFGLAFALERQRRWGEAARLYQAIVDEYGSAPLDNTLLIEWHDPWDVYWPAQARPSGDEHGAPIAYTVGSAARYRLAAIATAQQQAAVATDGATDDDRLRH